MDLGPCNFLGVFIIASSSRAETEKEMAFIYRNGKVRRETLRSDETCRVLLGAMEKLEFPGTNPAKICIGQESSGHTL